MYHQRLPEFGWEWDEEEVEEGMYIKADLDIIIDKIVANFFNPILNKLNIEVDLVNTEFTIPFKSKIKDEVVPVSSLSTGTKGLLLTMFPLYELDTNDAIILMDEPERSLFRDMQIDLITHYQNLAPNAQFIIATHSPFIAAAFETEERFILYFDALALRYKSNKFN
jgi:predicted ATPase